LVVSGAKALGARYTLYACVLLHCYFAFAVHSLHCGWEWALARDGRTGGTVSQGRMTVGWMGKGMADGGIGWMGQVVCIAVYVIPNASTDSSLGGERLNEDDYKVQGVSQCEHL